MRFWKSIVIVALLVIGIYSVCGCKMTPQENVEELQIKAPKNHLVSWKEELSRDNEYTTWNSSAVRGVEIRKSGDIVFAASYEPREGKDTFDYWDISEPYQSMVSVNTEELYRLFDSIFQIGWDAVNNIGIAEAGIKDSDTSIFIAYNREQKSGEKGPENPTAARTILIGNTDGQGNYYAALEGSEEVARVDQDLVDSILNVNPFQYVLKLPALINMNTVEKVQILSSGKHFSMENNNGTWKVNGKSVEKETFQSFYGKLLDIMISGEIDGEATRNKKTVNNEDSMGGKERQPMLTLQFIRNIEEASDVEITYYEYDQQSMSVSVNGQEFFLVEKDIVCNLMRDIEKNF